MNIQKLQPTASDIDSLSVIPFLNDSGVITGLKEELPAYLARANGANTPDICQWWNNETALPNWSGAAKKSILVQPSSAASERVFSNNTWTKANNTLVDYIESCLMVQYNNHSL